MATAAAAGAPGAGTGSSAAPSSRFAAACGALGQYVKAAERARPAGPVRPLLLMPGADIDACVPDEGQEQSGAGPAPAQRAIVYGGRVLVLDDVAADKAASLLRLAAVAARGGAVEPQASGRRAVCGGQLSSVGDLPVARKASLQRFMEKRKGRVAARGTPYHRPDGSDSCPDDYLKLAL